MLTWKGQEESWNAMIPGKIPTQIFTPIFTPNWCKTIKTGVEIRKNSKKNLCKTTEKSTCIKSYNGL